MHPLRMPRQRLAYAWTSLLPHLPELDATIPARAGQLTAVGGKGQSPHPVAMPPERLYAGSWLGLPRAWDLPHPNVSIKAATGEQAPIWTPGQREDRTGMRQRLQGCAQLRIPEPHRRVIAPTGEHASVRSKGQPVGALGMPARPERSTTFDVPERDAAIKARAGEGAFVRAEGEGN